MLIMTVDRIQVPLLSARTAASLASPYSLAGHTGIYSTFVFTEGREDGFMYGLSHLVRVVWIRRYGMKEIQANIAKRKRSARLCR